MTAIIIPRRHYTQPQGRVTLSALAQSLNASAWLPVGRDILDVKRGALVSPVRGAPYPMPTDSGMAVAAASESNTVFDLETISTPDFVGKAIQDAGAFVAVLMVSTNGLVANRNPLISSGPNSTYYPFNIYQVFDSHRLGFGIGSIADTTIDLRDYPGMPVVCRLRDGVRDIWVAGAQRYVSGYSTSNNAASAASFPISLLNFNSTYNISRAPNASVSAAALLPVAATDALMRDLSTDIWQLFRADPIRIYSLPSGPISISWSSLTASNITQTGARLTLGGITR